MAQQQHGGWRAAQLDGECAVGSVVGTIERCSPIVYLSRSDLMGRFASSASSATIRRWVTLGRSSALPSVVTI
jgi:hypothetical protein